MSDLALEERIATRRSVTRSKMVGHLHAIAKNRDTRGLDPERVVDVFLSSGGDASAALAAAALPAPRGRERLGRHLQYPLKRWLEECEQAVQSMRECARRRHG